MAPPTIRGVSLFISDVRNCPSSLHEQARILQEIAKIRQRFTQPKKPLTGYEKKKCLTKLLYIHLLGYPVDVGHAEAISLLSSPHYSERAAAYLFCSLHLLESSSSSSSSSSSFDPQKPGGGAERNFAAASSDLRRLCCNSIKKDLSFLVGNEDFLVLALDSAAHVTDRALASDLFSHVQAIANPASPASPYVRQKAYGCMLQFFRVAPDVLPCEVWASRLSHSLLFEKDISCLLSLSNLIYAAVLQTDKIEIWQSPLKLSVVNTLARIVSRDIPEDFFYHDIPAPWLSIRLLQILQLFRLDFFHGTTRGRRSAHGAAEGEGQDEASGRENKPEDAVNALKQQQEALVLSLNEIIKKIFAQTFEDPQHSDALASRSGSSSFSTSGFKSRFSQAFRSSSSLSARLASLAPFTLKPSAASSSSSSSAAGGGGGGGGKKRFEWHRKRRGLRPTSTSIIQHAVLYESIHLVSHLQSNADEELKQAAAALLCSFIEEGNPNFRYKSLSLIGSMAEDADVKLILKNSLPAILKLLDEEDVSLRRQAVCLSFALSDEENWSFVVSALLSCLEKDEETLQEQIATQITVLVETYAPDPTTWLLDATFKILYTCPDVRDETWVHAVQCVAGVSEMDFPCSSSSTLKEKEEREEEGGGKKDKAPLQSATTGGRRPPNVELQKYAASRAAEFLQDPELNATMLRLCAYIVGEFGHQVRGRGTSGRDQLRYLLFHFHRFLGSSSSSLAAGSGICGDFSGQLGTQEERGSGFPPYTFISTHADPASVSACSLLPLLLLAIVKLSFTNPKDVPAVLRLLHALQDHRDVELQTRAVELSALLQLPDKQLVSQTLSLLPPFRRGQLVSRHHPQQERTFSSSSSLAGGNRGGSGRASGSNGETRATDEDSVQSERSLWKKFHDIPVDRSLRDFDLAALGVTLLSSSPRDSSSPSEGQDEEEEEEARSNPRDSRAISKRTQRGSLKKGAHDEDLGKNDSRASSRSQDEEEEEEKKKNSWRSRERRESTSKRSSNKVPGERTRKEEDTDEEEKRRKRTSRVDKNSRRTTESGRRRRGGVGGGGHSERSSSEASSSSLSASASSSSSLGSSSGEDNEEEDEEEVEEERARKEEQVMQQRLLQVLQTAPGSREGGDLLWRKLCICKEGVWVSIPGILEVYVHRKFEKKDGMLHVEWRNLSSDRSLSIQRECFAVTRELLAKEEDHSPNASYPPLSMSEGDKKLVNIPPRQSTAYRIRLRCMQPFLNLPSISARVVAFPSTQNPAGGRGVQEWSVPLNPPVVLANFVVPARAVSTPQAFRRYWDKLGKKKSGGAGGGDQDDERERNQMNEREISITRPLAVPIQHIGVYVQGGFNLQPVKIRRSLCGSGILYTGTLLPEGTKNFIEDREDQERRIQQKKNKRGGHDISSSLGPAQFLTAFVMCVVEVNPNTTPVLARVTVRTTHPRVSFVFSRLLSSFLLLLQPPANSPVVDASSVLSLSSDSSLPPSSFQTNGNGRSFSTPPSFSSMSSPPSSSSLYANNPSSSPSSSSHAQLHAVSSPLSSSFAPQNLPFFPGPAAIARGGAHASSPSASSPGSAPASSTGADGGALRVQFATGAGGGGGGTSPPSAASSSSASGPSLLSPSPGGFYAPSSPSDPQVYLQQMQMQGQHPPNLLTTLQGPAQHQQGAGGGHRGFSFPSAHPHSLGSSSPSTYGQPFYAGGVY